MIDVIFNILIVIGAIVALFVLIGFVQLAWLEIRKKEETSAGSSWRTGPRRSRPR